jgi:hypothetical protein
MAEEDLSELFEVARSGSAEELADRCMRHQNSLFVTDQVAMKRAIEIT